MKRRIFAVTGSRAEYGSMRPVFGAIVSGGKLHLELIVTGMHMHPAFRDSLEEIRKDAFGRLHMVQMVPGDDTGKAMAQALGRGILGIAEVFNEVGADVVLLQGDRSEMLAAAVAAAHMNIPIVHMSGGDLTGTIDQPVRNAISQFAHVHLTTCADSTERLRQHGESPSRIFEVGEPTLDVILKQEFAKPEELARDLRLDLSAPVVIATMHPVTTESAQAGAQIAAVLDALESFQLQTVFTYPNTDAGGEVMRDVLESRRGRDWLRIFPHLGSYRYLGLMRIASVMVGNSSSGIIEAPSFGLPVVNVGTRQYGRSRAANVVDVNCTAGEIATGIRKTLENPDFRVIATTCSSPYGDGRAGVRAADILARLRISPALICKWIDSSEAVLD